MVVIRSIIFNVIFILWTAIIALLSMVVIPFLSPARVASTIGWCWGASCIWLLRVICNMCMEVRGEENIPSGPCIIASKHQSAWETMAFYCMVKLPVFVIKKELLSIPLYGRCLKAAGSIAVDREAGASALKGLVNQTKQRLAEGRTVIIFPEGTRTSPGDVPSYQPGIVALYARAGAPVVPVALNSGCFWRRNAFLKHPGTIIVEFLPAIEPELRRDQFMTILESTIETRSEALYVPSKNASDDV